MLQLKHELQTFLRCNVGDGNTASFWYDYWTELGPLHLMFGSSGARSLRIPLNATVSQAVSNGNWNLPPARSESAKTLQIILSTMSVPSAESGGYVYLWRNQSGGFGPSFSARVTWEMIRMPSPLVPWQSVVWFKEELPPCSFITWTAYLGRLPTRDRLISWGLSVPTGCVLCSAADDSNSHLCFECVFAAATWSRFYGRYMASPPASLAAVLDSCQHIQGPHVARAVIVLKLLNQVIIYSLWRERNARIFKSITLTQEAFFHVVDRAMRDRLLSLSRPTAAVVAPSLLELYF
ncbi:PREDICTED: uncharacterized protein LOC106314729 [Brassica oleracea var. oleracea]|uniref:uncharacterized protein LOC106314729 n=1 Tax=Brassica oleracea var. oleracea TaxID=109376 RepID=UPI0006A748A2|nr:PREDICTED: uncharacterized protein LOC106314729 [Brassica oleracea var. oleracea]